MRFRRLRVEAFGGISGLDTGEDALPGLVAVVGPNEAGKSTLFHFLTTMLYGFYPATRGGNPYAPWDGADPAGVAELELDGGGCVEVERRLRSQPSARMKAGGREEELRNRALPWVDHIPLKVYEQVFAIGLADLATLDTDTWHQVQDRLIGSMGAADLRGARAVAQELEDAAGALWRPTRRGNQRIRDLRDAMAAQRERRQEAVDRDARLRAAVAELDEARQRLTEAREARQRHRVALERAEELLPLRRQLSRIDELRGEAGDAASLDGLPADPRQALTTLEDEIRHVRERMDDLAQTRQEPEERVAAYGEGDARMVDRAAEVRAFLARAAGALPERGRVASLTQDLSDLDRRLETAAAEALACPWTDAPTEHLHALPITQLRGAVRELQRAEEALRLARAEQAAAPAPPPAPRTPTGAVWAAVASGLALLAAGVALASLPMGALGAALAAVGATMLAFSILARPDSAPPANEPRGGAERVERARAALAALLRGIPVHPRLLDEPDASLPASLERLQELLRDRTDRERSLREAQERLALVDRDARTLAASLGEDPTLEPQALVHLLESELERAERRCEGARHARRELDRLDREAARAHEVLERATARRDALRTRLEALGGGSVEAGLAEAERRLGAAARARELEAELERTHPDVETARRRVRGAGEQHEAWGMDDDEVARRRAEAEGLTDRIEELVKAVEALDGEVARLREEDTVDAVDGALQALEEEESRLIRVRDRAWVLAQLIREADRRFREEHQPDVMRRAGAHLHHLTGGRYDRIHADDSPGPNLFMVSGPGAPEPLPLAPPLSMGTLEQAYLALRLAVVDHLDQGQERLPLILDEVLVNWDRERRQRGIEALEAIARSRQVFLFTCHPGMAEAFWARGGRVLEVGGRG